MRNIIIKDPYSYRKAIETETSQKWLEAKSEDINSLIETGVWEIVDRPYGKNGEKNPTVDSRWISKTKTNSDGSTLFKDRRVIS